jgi:branched-chain amino acid transport system substrate-binding protein
MLALRVAKTVSVLGVAALLAAGCAGSGGDGGTKNADGVGKVRLGLFVTSSGDYAQYGRPYERGVRVAADYLRDKGRLDADFEVRNTDNNPAENVAGVRDLAAKKIDIILTYDGSLATVAAGPVAQRSKVLLFAGATSMRITKAGDWVWQAPTPTQPLAGTGIVAILKKLNAKRVGLVESNDEYGAGTAEFVRQEAKKAGIEIVESVKFSETDTDIAPQVRSIREAKVDAVAVASLMRGGALFTKQGRENGIDMPIVAPNSWVSEDYLKLAGSTARDIYATADFIPDPAQNEALGKDFIARYEKKYGEAPNAFAADGFDQLLMLAKGIEDAGSSDADAVRGAFKKLTLDGVTGRGLHFGDDRSIRKNTLEAVVRDGKWVAFK